MLPTGTSEIQQMAFAAKKSICSTNNCNLIKHLPLLRHSTIPSPDIDRKDPNFFEDFHWKVLGPEKNQYSCALVNFNSRFLGFQGDKFTSQKSIAHFQVHISLSIKARLGAQPFIWKWVYFASEWNLVFIWKDEHQDSFWGRGLNKFRNGLFIRHLFSSMLELAKVVGLFNYFSLMWRTNEEVHNSKLISNSLYNVLKSF